MNQEAHAEDYGGHEAELRGSQSVSVLPSRTGPNSTDQPPTTWGCTMDDRDPGELIRVRGRENHSMLLKCLARVSQKVVASRIGVGEATMSGIKDEHMLRFCAIVDACGLKLVRKTDRTCDDEYLSALETLAQRGIGGNKRSATEGADE